MKIQRYLSLIILLTCCSAELITVSLSKKDGGMSSDINAFKKIQKFLTASSSDYVIDTLENYKQMMYAGNIQVGKEKKEYKVIFDTGSNTLWLPSTNCVDSNRCDGLSNSYTCSASDGCTQTQLCNKLEYGKGQAEGCFANTLISVCDLQPVTQKLLLVHSTNDLSNLQADGLFGLGMYDDQNQDKNSFVSNLQKNGQIKEAMFSFYLGFGKENSELVFGGYNPDKLKDPSQMYYHKVIMNGNKNNHQRWSIGMKTFSISSLSFNFPDNANTVIVDSGTSLITFPKSLYQKFQNLLINKYNAKLVNFQALIVSCSEDLPDMNFILTDSQNVDRKYSIPKSFYVYDLGGDNCQVMVQALEVGDVQVILGNVFMRRYVSIFSHTNSTVGLSLSVASPDDDDTRGLQGWVIALIVIGALLIIGIIAFCVYKQVKKRRDQNRLNNQLLQNNQNPNQYPPQNQQFIGHGVPIGSNSYQPPNHQNQGYIQGRPIQGGFEQNNNYPPILQQNNYPSS